MVNIETVMYHKTKKCGVLAATDVVEVAKTFRKRIIIFVFNNLSNS